MITKADILNDFIVAIPLFIWIIFVIKYLSRWVYNLGIKKGYLPESAAYLGRKIIHIFGSGLITLSIPFLFKEPFLPFLSALILAIYTFLPHKKGELYNWFQVKENINEVNFCLMWGLSILIGWFFDKTFCLGVIPALFISFGDGVTGIVRNLRYRKRTKAWEGSLAMLLVCLLIGSKMGWPGIIAGIAATIAERFEFIDDNISIILVSFSILLIFFLFYPHLIQPLF